MNAPKRALLLVGSPKGLNRGSSARLGKLLFDRLAESGIETDALHVHALFRAGGVEGLRKAVSRADLTVLAAPLYVDSLPAPVMWAMERLAGAQPSESRGRFAAIFNCGFPEVTQIATCVAICQRFCQEAGYAWCGALTFGGTGGPTRRVRRALALAATALAAGESIPPEAVSSKPAVPPWTYLAGNLAWRIIARRQGAKDSLRARPYDLG